MDSDDSLAEHAKLERIPSIIVKNAVTNDIGSNNATSIKNLHPVVAQQMLQPRCKSSVWVYFQRLETALAKCRICHNNYRFGSSISNLRHHAELKHADVLRQGPVKFLERLKVPKEDVAKLMITTREKAKRSNKIKNLHEELLELSDETHVELEPTQSGESNFSANENEDMQQTIDSIYEKSDNILNDYLQTSPKSTTTESTKRKTRSTSIPHVDCSNNSYFLDDDEEETDIDCLRSNNFISTIIAKNAVTNDIGSDNATSIKNLHPVVAQQMLQPRCRSSVWVYFQRLETALAKCRICRNNYRFGSSISNLRHHAELKHADVLRQGPVKFLERLKVPKEDVAKLMITTREKAKRSNKIKNLHEELLELSDETHAKLEPTQSGESNFSANEDEDMQQTIDSIYEKSDNILNDYLQTSPKSTTTASTKRKTRSTSIPHVDCSNNSYFLDDDEEETDIDCLRSNNFISTNPLNTTAHARNAEKMLYLREERLRAEINYFDKKAVFMERSTEFIEIQKRHVMLQTHKLKLEITAMKDSLYRP